MRVGVAGVAAEQDVLQMYVSAVRSRVLTKGFLTGVYIMADDIQKTSAAPRSDTASRGDQRNKEGQGNQGDPRDTANQGGNKGGTAAQTDPAKQGDQGRETQGGQDPKTPSQYANQAAGAKGREGTAENMGSTYAGQGGKTGTQSDPKRHSGMTNQDEANAETGTDTADTDTDTDTDQKNKQPGGKTGRTETDRQNKHGNTSGQHDDTKPM